MCFSYDSQPPNLPHHHGDGGRLPPGISVTGGVASAQDVVLTSADGTQFAAYIARPQASSGAGIVILPDVRGLFAFYKDLAERFASAGVEAIALDYFGRTAGLTPRGDDFDYMPPTLRRRNQIRLPKMSPPPSLNSGHPASKRHEPCLQ